VLNTLVGEEEVVVVPGETSSNEALAGEGLHELDDVKVGNINLVVLVQDVLLGNNKTLLLEVIGSNKKKTHTHTQKKKPPNTQRQKYSISLNYFYARFWLYGGKADLEKVGHNGDAILLGNKHFCFSLCVND
jgi:hypothetical protein